MNDPRDEKDFDETEVLEDRQESETDTDADATVVLGEDYRRKIESGTD